MESEIIIAIIGAIGVIVAAWISTKVRRKNKASAQQVTKNVVGGDQIGGDKVGRDKVESHEHIHVKGSEPERKSAMIYWLEKVFTFVFTCLIAGALFGGIGYAIGQETGAIIGGVLALIAGLVNAGSVKRTKGIM